MKQMHRPLARTRYVYQASAIVIALLGAKPGLAQHAPEGLEQAIATASTWASLADANRGEAMWKVSSSTMQRGTSQADWVKYIGTIHQQAGAEQSRTWVGLNKVDNPHGMPAGEYLNVVYVTHYANVATYETVSMAKTGSHWQPVGYVVHPIQQQAQAHQPANAQPQAAPAGK